MIEKPLCEHFSHYEPKPRKVCGFGGKEFTAVPWPFEYFQYEFPNHWLVVEQDPFSRSCGHYIEFINSESMEYHKVLLSHRQHMAICHELLTITSWKEFFDYIHDLELQRDATLTQRDVIQRQYTLFDFDDPF